MKLHTKFLRYAFAFLIPLIFIAAFPLLKVGDKAPDFTLAGITSDSISLNNYKGKVVVVHIWSHTCPHCREMNKTLPGTVKPYKKSNLAYIMVDIDTDTTGLGKVIREDKLDFAIHAIDPHDGAAKTMINYGGRGTPYISIVNENGTIAVLNSSEEQLKRYLKKHFPAKK